VGWSRRWLACGPTQRWWWRRWRRLQRAQDRARHARGAPSAARCTTCWSSTHRCSAWRLTLSCRRSGRRVRSGCAAGAGRGWRARVWPCSACRQRPPRARRRCCVTRWCACLCLAAPCHSTSSARATLCCCRGTARGHRGQGAAAVAEAGAGAPQPPRHPSTRTARWRAWWWSTRRAGCRWRCPCTSQARCVAQGGAWTCTPTQWPTSARWPRCTASGRAHLMTGRRAPRRCSAAAAGRGRACRHRLRGRRVCTPALGAQHPSRAQPPGGGAQGRDRAVSRPACHLPPAPAAAAAALGTTDAQAGQRGRRRQQGCSASSAACHRGQQHRCGK